MFPCQKLNMCSQCTHRNQCVLHALSQSLVCCFWYSTIVSPKLQTFPLNLKVRACQNKQFAQCLANNCAKLSFISEDFHHAFLPGSTGWLCFEHVQMQWLECVFSRSNKIQLQRGKLTSPTACIKTCKVSWLSRPKLPLIQHTFSKANSAYPQKSVIKVRLCLYMEVPFSVAVSRPLLHKMSPVESDQGPI